MMIRLDEYGINFDDSCLYGIIEKGFIISYDLDSNPSIVFGGWELIRAVRKFYLKNCDWTQMPDAPLSDEQKALWQAYRQALRDIPQVYTNYLDVRFPSIPSEV